MSTTMFGYKYNLESIQRALAMYKEEGSIKNYQPASNGGFNIDLCGGFSGILTLRETAALVNGLASSHKFYNGMR